ncbi:hypothetical protein J2X46_004170 [Nocardioides sp. BE266]|uniref:hypothetical protein n=1 Tax=Nocardioides sp. BE266 TaxID=2817725 RepID=UPI00285FEA67|nr:hypothetical protein [Nocardioides sp. BE266]MDR7255168.1 hypothetical protein [Nocardioides sp. BE266]
MVPSRALYTPDDHSQAHDLADEQPERLARLKELFLVEAAKYDVFPLDDRKAERLDPKATGRPDLMGGRTSLTVYSGAMHLGESTVPDVNNRSHVITAEITVGDEPANGAIVAQGGRFGGWTLFLNDSVPAYCHNWVDHERYYVRAEAPLPPGRHTVRYEFDYDGGGAGLGGTGRILVDDDLVAEGRIEHTCGYLFATTDALDVAPEQHSDSEGLARAQLARQ